MALKYELSGAGVAVDSLMKQIENAASIENMEYQMLSNNTKLSITMAVNAKNYTTAQLQDEASSMRANAIAGIIGGAGALAITGASLAASAYYQNVGDKLSAEPNESETEVVTAPKVGTGNDNEFEMAEFKGTNGSSSADGAGAKVKAPEAAEIQGQDVAKDTDAAASKKIDKTADADAKAKKTDSTSQSNKEDDIRKTQARLAYRKSDTFMANGAQFGQSVNTIVNGFGGLSAASFKDTQAVDAGLATLYNNMPTVFNNIQTMNNGVISAEEQNKQGDTQIWSSLVQTSNSGMRG